MIFATKPLGDLFDVRAGNPAPQSSDAFCEEGTPFIRAGSLAGLLAGAPLGSLEQISQVSAKRFRLTLFAKDTILFAKSGMSALKGHIYQLPSQAYVVSHLAALTPKPGVNARYVRWALESFSPTRLVKDVAYPSVRLPDIEQMEIPLPPLDEQRRIAAILDQADALRRKRRETLERLRLLEKASFIKVVGDPMINDRGWPTRRIGDVGAVVTGNTPPRSESGNYGNHIDWIKSDNLNNAEYFATRSAEQLSETGAKRARIAPSGSILVTCIAGSPDCIGNAAMLDRPAAFNQQINAILPKDIDPHFLYAQIRLFKKIIQRSSTNSMKGMVNKSKFESIEIITPPSEVQRELCELLGSIRSSQNAAMVQLLKLDALFASLQHRAFRGEL